MPNLNLLAKTSCTYNPADGVSNVFIFVKVTDESDTPVKGLLFKDVKVWRGMQNEELSFVAPQGETEMPGIYAIALKKTLGALKGQFVYTVRVKTGSGRQTAKGWTLTDLVKL